LANSKGKNTVAVVEGIAAPIAEGLGLRIWDVRYLKEGAQWYLRVFIDKDGGVDINDCEAVSRAVDPILDEKDPIPESYHFEVCSAGLERALKRPSDFEQFMGSAVMVKLYQPRNGSKELKGTLTGYENGDVTIDQAGTSVKLEKKEVALVRLYVEF
jgi:ribosome maturation factor RimP